jgi:hypothetical protein
VKLWLHSDVHYLGLLLLDTEDVKESKCGGSVEL